MKFKEAKRLTVGKVYCDLTRNSNIATYLKLIKREGRVACFEYGHNGYISDDDGLIRLGGKGGFHKPTEAQLKEILKS
jgi:hypothetical protein